MCRNKKYDLVSRETMFAAWPDANSAGHKSLVVVADLPEAHAAVRTAQGAPEQLRVVATSTLAEFVVSPLTEAFRRRFAGPLEVSAGVAVTQEMGVLVGNRLADVALGPAVTPDPALPVVSEPIFRYRLVVVTTGESRLKGNARQWRWLVDPAGTDPDSDTGRLLAALRIPDSRIGVFPNQTAAWAAAAQAWRPLSSTSSRSNYAGASSRWPKYRHADLERCALRPETRIFTPMPATAVSSPVPRCTPQVTRAAALAPSRSAFRPLSVPARRCRVP